MGKILYRALALLLISALILSCYSYSYGQGRNALQMDGTDWLGDSGQVYAKWLNVGIIVGVKMGAVTTYTATRELIDRINNEFYGQRTTSVIELKEKMAELTLYNITSNQFLAGIDALYEDPANRKIKIIDAVYITKMKVLGMDPELIDAQIRCLRMQPVHYKTLADALNKFALISNENEKKKIGRKVTNEDIKSGKISLEEVIISRHFVDRNDENHSLFCYGDYYGERN
jgi:hypothetical protein